MATAFLPAIAVAPGTVPSDNGDAGLGRVGSPPGALTFSAAAVGAAGTEGR